MEFEVNDVPSNYINEFFIYSGLKERAEKVDLKDFEDEKEEEKIIVQTIIKKIDETHQHLQSNAFET